MSAEEVTQDELDMAVVQFHKSDELKKAADLMREESRGTILLALEQGLCQAGDIIAGDKKVRLTVPMSKGKPASFDQSKAEEFMGFCKDTYRSLLPAFTSTTTHVVNFEVLLALLKAVGADKTSLLSKVEGYIIPAVEGVPMEPRLKAS